ncbi:RloB family protein [Fusobacterium necrophorum]|uniref:RloB-like protein n=1 Tax=Fusobacterium necrophorum DJ-2 TaxID=1441737 RepID=A0AB73BZD8_9FUSO|nr:RloB family protein [Fusobacterium necrophorum]KDE61673.1 RloB-like protein [Fusobacterium necrophorum DJ-1]KDE68779.1 RloB-like protein [Fusobacterium necrophorum DJ-2]MCF0163432.1 RloB domain-containing protein [Fusobacterium necrophorum]
MRENRTFAERTRRFNGDRTRKKYFLVYEGSNTEEIYFKAVNELRNEIGIHPLIELVSLIRSYSEEGWSNPKKILECLMREIGEKETGKISYKTLLDKVMETILEERQNLPEISNISRKTIFKTLEYCCKENMKKSMEDTVENVEESCKKLLFLLNKRFFMERITEILENTMKNIEKGGITYSKDFDKVCFIVDRDKDSFTEKQYNFVLEKCRENSFGFYITNPCFEFWLLLHFEEVLSINKEKLLLNNRVNSKNRYVEAKLKEILPKYSKTRYDAELLVKNIDKAIENEKMFCEDIEDLKNQLGSNLGVLIQEMRKNK